MKIEKLIHELQKLQEKYPESSAVVPETIYYCNSGAIDSHHIHEIDGISFDEKTQSIFIGHFVSCI